MIRDGDGGHFLFNGEVHQLADFGGAVEQRVIGVAVEVYERLFGHMRVVGTGRFELPTCRLGGDRSIHLSYVPAN